MLSRVKLIQIRGSDRGREYNFFKPTACVIGRASDCTIRVEPIQENVDVSRHHCRLDIDPPFVRVHDLHSLNGTYVNGIKVAQDNSARALEDRKIPAEKDIVLDVGDELRLGSVTTFRVEIRADNQDEDSDQTCAIYESSARRERDR